MNTIQTSNQNPMKSKMLALTYVVIRCYCMFIAKMYVEPTPQSKSDEVKKAK